MRIRIATVRGDDGRDDGTAAGWKRLLWFDCGADIVSLHSSRVGRVIPALPVCATREGEGRRIGDCACGPPPDATGHDRLATIDWP